MGDKKLYIFYNLGSINLKFESYNSYFTSFGAKGNKNVTLVCHSDLDSSSTGVSITYSYKKKEESTIKIESNTINFIL